MTPIPESLAPDPEWSGVDLTNPQAVLAHALNRYGSRLAVASSFSLEDILVIDWAHQIDPNVRVFSLDTGRLPEETYEVAEQVRLRYGIAIDWYHPQPGAVEELLKAKGPYSFKDSLDARHECCHIRKVEPLQRALVGLDAWVTGQRKAQSITRTDLGVLEPGKGPNAPLKINPLADWTLEDARSAIKERKLPYNRLYDAGYTSVGCGPCTRAVQPHEDERAGRWWWEQAEHKECGLHGRPGFEHLATLPRKDDSHASV